MKADSYERGRPAPPRVDSSLARRLPAEKRASLLGLVGLALVAGAPVAAWADEDADQQAEALFEEGRALMKAGRFEEACPKLEKSQRLSPHGGTLLNVAACHERIGKVSTAWVEFHQALTAARTDGKEDRARLAEERIAALEPRVAWIALQAPAEPGETISVTLDGASLAPIALGKEMPVDPGPHEILWSAPGHTTRRVRVVLVEGEHKSLSISLEPTAPALAAAVPEGETSRHEERAPAAAPPPTSGPRRHRLLLEAGGFIGLQSGANVSNARPEDPSTIQLRTDAGMTSNCGSVGCDFNAQIGESIVGGATGFVGYTATERFAFGLRGIGALRLGGGFLVAAGPALTGRIWGPLWAGFSLLAGDVAVRADAAIKPLAQGYAAISPAPSVWVHSGITVGNGVELDLVLSEAPWGALLLQTTPVFLITSPEISVTLPIGIALRFY